MLALDDEEESEEPMFSTEPMAEDENELDQRRSPFAMQTNGSRQDFEIIDKSINSQNALSEEPPKTNQDEDGEGN